MVGVNVSKAESSLYLLTILYEFYCHCNKITYSIAVLYPANKTSQTISNRNQNTISEGIFT